MKTMEDFDSFYTFANPWGVDGSISDIVRINIINDYFKNENFESGIDIACGEGYLTNNLNFIQNKIGIDISKKAIARAKKYYSDINFKVGDFETIANTNQIYDFVSCFEALYYPPNIESRLQALKNIANLGNGNTYFAFSVVTIGSNIHRDYFTKETFSQIVQEYYYIEKILPLTMIIENFYLRIIFKILKLISTRLLIYFQKNFTLRANDKYIYQHLFIVKKK